MPKTVGIYSVGLLGGSLGLALKHSGFGGRIVGFSSAANLATARDLGCIDEGLPYESLPDAISTIDFLVLCAPIHSILATLEKLASIDLPAGLIVSDVGSTKRQIVETARRLLPPHVHFIGGHPMAGSEKSGPSAADPYLFQNAIYVLTPSGGEPAQADRDLATFLGAYLGCRTLFLEAGIHDRIAAAVSHLPHLLAVALVCVAGDVEQAIPGALDLAAGGFRDMTRIASARYGMWHDILSTNRSAIEPLIDSLVEKLTGIKEDLRAGSLEAAFERASTLRARVPLTNKGFIGSLSEILVRVKDQPGMIAAISNALASKGINIKDIEVLKVREGEGGTIRLAFESPAKAREAISLLAANGFHARERT